MCVFSVPALSGDPESNVEKVVGKNLNMLSPDMLWERICCGKKIVILNPMSQTVLRTTRGFFSERSFKSSHGARDHRKRAGTNGPSS